MAVRTLVDAADHPENQRLVWGPEIYHFMESECARDMYPHQKALYQAVEKAAKIDPWTRHMIAGQYYLAQGWYDRGGGYANTVTPAGAASFQENIVKAGEHLTKAWQLNPKWPAAAAMMIEIAVCEPDGELSPRDWFDRAVAAQIRLCAGVRQNAVVLPAAVGRKPSGDVRLRPGMRQDRTLRHQRPFSSCRTSCGTSTVNSKAATPGNGPRSTIA